MCGIILIMIQMFNNRYYVREDGKNHYFFHIEDGVCSFLAPSKHHIELLPFLQCVQSIVKKENVHTFRQIPFFLNQLATMSWQNILLSDLSDTSVTDVMDYTLNNSIPLFKEAQLPRIIKKRGHLLDLPSHLLLTLLTDTPSKSEFFIQNIYYFLWKHRVDGQEAWFHKEVMQYYDEHYPQLVTDFAQIYSQFELIYGDTHLDETGKLWIDFNFQCHKTMIVQPEIMIHI